MNLASLRKEEGLRMFTAWMYFGAFCIAEPAWISLTAMIVTVLIRKGMA